VREALECFEDKKADAARSAYSLLQMSPRRWAIIRRVTVISIGTVAAIHFAIEHDKLEYSDAVAEIMRLKLQED